MSTRGWEGVTPQDVTRRELKQATMPQKRRSKYGATKTTVLGIAFDSAKEGRRYQELLALVAAKAIHQLQVQPEFPLLVGDVQIAIYRADFSYYELTGRTIADQEAELVVEDVKSVATRKKETYRLKKKHFEAQYRLVIREV